ncbi:hypothetical protein ABPG74_003076 [Tetrahymena malaccensis]
MEQYLKNKYFQITNGKQLNIDFKIDPIEQLKAEISHFKSFVSIVKEYCENKGIQVQIITEQDQSIKGYVSQVIVNKTVFCQGIDLVKRISREVACQKFIQKCLTDLLTDFEINEENNYDQGELVSNSLDFSKLENYDPLVNYIHFLQVFQNYSKIPNFKFRFKERQDQNEVVDFIYNDQKVEGVGITKFQAKNQATFKMLQTIKKTDQFQNFMKKIPENENQENLKQPNIKKRQRKQRKHFQTQNLKKNLKSDDVKQLIVIDLDPQQNEIKQKQQKVQKQILQEKNACQNNEEIKNCDKKQLGNQIDKEKYQPCQHIQTVQKNEVKQKEQNQNQYDSSLENILFSEQIELVKNNNNPVQQIGKIQQNQDQESENSHKKQSQSKSQSEVLQIQKDDVILDDLNGKQLIVIQDQDNHTKNNSFMQDKSVICINLDNEMSQQDNLKILSNINSNQTNQLFKNKQHETEESKSNEVNSQNSLYETIKIKCQNNNENNLQITKYFNQTLFSVGNNILYNSLTQKIFENISYNSISQEVYIQIANMIDNIDVFNKERQLGVLLFQIVGSLLYKIICKDQIVGDIVIVCDASLSKFTEDNIKTDIFKKIQQLSIGSKVKQYFNCLSLKNNKIKLNIYIEFIQDKVYSLDLHHWSYMKCFHQSILQSKPIQSIFMAVRRLRIFYMNKINVCILDALIIFVTKQLQYVEPCQNMIELLNLIILIGNYPSIDNLTFLENFMEIHKIMIKKDFNQLKNLSLQLKDLPKEKMFDFLNIQQVNQEVKSNKTLNSQ